MIEYALNKSGCDAAAGTSQDAHPSRQGVPSDEHVIAEQYNVGPSCIETEPIEPRILFLLVLPQSHLLTYIPSCIGATAPPLSLVTNFVILLLTAVSYDGHPHASGSAWTEEFKRSTRSTV